MWITEYAIVYLGRTSYTVSIMEFKGGKVVHETQYFADPFEAPAWRAQWVEQAGIDDDVRRGLNLVRPTGNNTVPRLLSVNVGLPRDVTWRGQTVHTGVWKDPVQGRRIVRRLNIEGDGQGDLAGHGGEHRAVMVYQIDSYRYWENQLGRNNFTFGQFGENFTVKGMADDEVCVGDRYRIGSAQFEVTQPRVTCYRVGIRMDEPQMAALLVSHHRPGFYLRVLEEGEVAAGDEILKVADGPERVTVAGIDALLYLPGHARDLLERSLRIPALSQGWKGSLQALLDQSRRAGSGYERECRSQQCRQAHLQLGLASDP